MTRKFSAVLLAFVAYFVFVAPAHAWSHQGHILITRLAALRILSDPAAPQGLKDFLHANMKYSMDDCAALAQSQVLGEPEYPQGLDNWCTLPDRIQRTAAGRKLIPPFDVPESQLHFMDMEYFAKDHTYKDDLSNRPAIADIPRDLHDPRWKLAGFVPLRMADCYQKLIAAFRRPDFATSDSEAAHWAGYLAHYTEDCTQPHHSTMDYKSYSYLYAGHVKGVRMKTTDTANGKVFSYFVEKGKEINPHADIEFKLFENNDEPLKTFRADFWKKLNADLTELSGKPTTTQPVTGHADPFMLSLSELSDGYGYLPFIGHAGVQAYANGTFDAKAFFGYAETFQDTHMSMIDLIALQNAKAALNVERMYREAWDEAQK